MKKVILTMVALLSMTAMQAQTSDNNERKAPKKPTPEEMTNRMVKDLGLTDAQKDKVLKLNKQYEDVLGMPAMRGPRPQKPEGMGEGGDKPDAQTGATPQRPERPEGFGGQRPQRPELTEAQRAEMQKRHAQREEYNTKLKDILTDDQYKSYQKMQRRGHGRGHGHGHGPGNHQGPRPDMAPQE